MTGDNKQRPLRVQLPAEPPTLTPEAARLLRRMIKAAGVKPLPTRDVTRCGICGGPFTDAQWVARHWRNEADVHEGCCPCGKPGAT